MTEGLEFICIYLSNGLTIANVNGMSPPAKVRVVVAEARPIMMFMMTRHVTTKLSSIDLTLFHLNSIQYLIQILST